MLVRFRAPLHRPTSLSVVATVFRGFHQNWPLMLEEEEKLPRKLKIWPKSPEKRKKSKLTKWLWRTSSKKCGEEGVLNPIVAINLHLIETTSFPKESLSREEVGPRQSPRKGSDGRCLKSVSFCLGKSDDQLYLIGWAWKSVLKTRLRIQAEKSARERWIKLPSNMQTILWF